MNERIKELAEQSGLVRGGYANGTDIMTWRESFDNPGSLEKFAELIEKNIDFSEPYLSGKSDGRYETIHECIEHLWQIGDTSGAQALEKYFGIKE